MVAVNAVVLGLVASVAEVVNRVEMLLLPDRDDPESRPFRM
jgi:hypothetical protein